MGKNGFLTPKAVANRQKAKGLQRLRWYCQMCQKQCRDENGCAPLPLPSSRLRARPARPPPPPFPPPPPPPPGQARATAG